MPGRSFTVAEHVKSDFVMTQFHKDLADGYTSSMNTTLFAFGAWSDLMPNSDCVVLCAVTAFWRLPRNRTIKL